MIVYLVAEQDYEDWTILKAFTDKAKAYDYLVDVLLDQSNVNIREIEVEE